MTDSPEETLALARTAAGAVRSLNHATLGGDGLAQPADAYAVLGELTLAAAGVSALLAQVGRWLASAFAAGRLGCDDGTSPAAAGGRRPPAPDRRPRLRGRARQRPRQRPAALAAVHGTPARGEGERS